MLEKIKTVIPQNILARVRPLYHYTLSLLSATFYLFPSRKIFVIGVTGTKGKTSTVELIGSILERAGYKIALSNTVRFKVCGLSENNRLKMTMPGRFFLQRFLRKAVSSGCDYVILEMTSEGVKQFRHKFISLNALVFTNLSPEHIESHGSYEKYRDAKLKIAQGLENSSKKRKLIVANNDDKEGPRFLSLAIEEKYPFSLADVKPFTLKKEGLSFTLKNRLVSSHLSGEFNLYNILAAVTLAKALRIGEEVIVEAIENFSGIPGRMQKIDEGQDFTVVVDYAHTADSLSKVYEVFGTSQKICVLGGTGGGRDVWKREKMGAVANAHCSHIVLTDEDPYDEDPRAIVEHIKKGVARKEIVEVIMDRREAIREALSHAKRGDTVLITGKGTDAYIMGPQGSKLPWSDAEVVKEELRALSEKRSGW
ncbi:MAG: UDP-N-acetylmuramoyl-L-alanyl-D-glutamate--2,6-diaminopimelate ligase [Candidatus Paceibacterota bacterium]